MLTILRQRNFALLWFGGLISIAGDWVLYIALPLYVYQLTGSTLATGAMFIAGIVPGLLISPIAGVFVDRWDRKRTLIITNLLSALVLLPLLAVHSAESVWIVYVVQFVESAIGQFIQPAKSALLPRLVGEEYLLQANSLNSLNNNLARLLGPPLGGIAAGLFGLAGVSLLDTASFLIAGAMIAAITASARPVRQTATPAPHALAAVANVWREWLEGLQLVRRERLIAIVFGILTITALGEGVMRVLFPPFVHDILNGGVLEIGWLMGAQAVGGLAGGLVVSSVARRVSLAQLIGLSAMAFGLIDLAIFNSPAIWPGMALQIILFVIVGVPGVFAMTGIDTLLQSSVADLYRGRIFATLGTTGALMGLVGTGLAGALGNQLGIVTLLNIQGAGYVVAGLMGLALLRGARMPGKVTTDAQSVRATDSPAVAAVE